jgi:hypothetical protein
MLEFEDEKESNLVVLEPTHVCTYKDIYSIFELYNDLYFPFFIHRQFALGLGVKCIVKGCSNLTCNDCGICYNCHPIDYDKNFKCNKLNRNVNILLNFENISLINKICEYIVINENIKILEWINNTENSFFSMFIDKIICNIIKYNKVSILQWFIDNNFNIYTYIRKD